VDLISYQMLLLVCNPESEPYSPNLVEEEFCEVHGSNLPRFAPSLMVSGWGELNVALYSNPNDTFIIRI